MCLVCSIHRDEGVVVVTARGDIDLGSAGDLARCLQTAMACVSRALELNLAAVTFIDVKGCRVLARAREACAARGVAFAVTAASPRIRRVMDLLELESRSPIVKSRAGVEG